MDASTRLYARLGEIPEDPNDPESLDDLIVCAFGAFERYYLCWKTKGGEFRQDGYDLPPALDEWLSSTNGTTRDWASLQVVFGRGEEYFASDKNGKLEFKESEVKRSSEEEEKGKVDKQALRRSRTVSFLRPISQTSTRADTATSETSIVDRRASSTSSQRASRPPSLSYSTKGSEASIALRGEPHSQQQESASAVQSSLSSLLASVGSIGSSTKAVAPTVDPKPAQSELGAKNSSLPTASTAPPAQNLDIATRDSYGSSKDPDKSAVSGIAGEATESNITTNKATLGPCTCGCHYPPLARNSRISYANASVQTDPVSLAPRTSLRVDTLNASGWRNPSYSAVSQAVRAPVFDNFGPIPFSMGRMTNYFSKPGYQLGDSLASSHHYYEQPVYQYQEEFGDEALR